MKIIKTLLKLFAVLISVFVLVGLGLYFFGTTDLRTTIAKNAPQVDKAKQLLEQMAIAHQIHYWDSLSTYQITFEDEFYGLIGKMGNPFPESRTKFSLQYIPNTYDGSLEILDGPKKEITGGFNPGIPIPYLMGKLLYSNRM